MTECGADRFRSIEAEPYGFGPLAKPRTTSDPCPGYISNECTGTEITAWQIKRNELLDERNKLLAELRASGCVWPQDLEDSITTTDGYALRYAEEWGVFGSGLAPLYASMFGVDLGNDINFTNVVQINLELISRLTCEIERLDLLNVAQECGADRPDPVIAKKRSSWIPAAVGAGLVVALVAGLRLGRSLR